MPFRRTYTQYDHFPDMGSHTIGMVVSKIMAVRESEHTVYRRLGTNFIWLGHATPAT